MIVKPDLITPDPPESHFPPEKRFDRLPKEVVRALAQKGNAAQKAKGKRHTFTPSERHRGGVIRGAQRTMQARSR